MAEVKALDMPLAAVATVWTMLFSWGPKPGSHFLRMEKPTMDFYSVSLS